jgi:hypothetical protein
LLPWLSTVVLTGAPLVVSLVESSVDWMLKVPLTIVLPPVTTLLCSFRKKHEQEGPGRRFQTPCTSGLMEAG